METQRKMHICVIQNVELGTTEALSVFLTNIAKGLSSNGAVVDLIVSNASEAPKELVHQVHSIFTTGTKLYSIFDNLKFSITAFFILRRIQKISNLDIIHCIRPNSSLLGATLFKVFVKHDAKIIYNVRSPWIDVAVLRKHIRPVFSWMFKHLAYFSEFVLSKFVWRFVFVSKPLLDYYSKMLHLSDSKTIVIPPGVDTEHFVHCPTDEIKKKLRKGPDNIFIGHVGGLSYERDLTFIIEAFKKIFEKDKRYRLVFVGDGPAKDMLQALSNDLGIGEFVIFTGKVVRDDVPKYMSILDIGISHLPDNLAYRCSFPLKILEYLSCKVPVVASDIVAHRDILNSIRGVFLYEFTIDSFVKTIVQVSKNVSNADYFIESQIQKYNWSVLAERYLRIL